MMIPVYKLKTQKPLTIAFAPHLHSRNSVRKIMWGCVFSLLPALAVSLIFFKGEAFRIFAFSLSAHVGFEALFQKWANQKVTVRNGHSVLLAILFALLLPPQMPWWIILLGSFISIIIAKEVFGGLGQYIFHPGLVAYGILVILFPQAAPAGWVSLVSQIGEPGVYAVLLCGLAALCLKRIPWEIPVVFLLTLGISLLFSGFTVIGLYRLAGVLLAAFFILTDPVSSPVTRMGRVIFAMGASAMTAVALLWTTDLIAVTSAILIMNASVPLLDRFSSARNR